MSHHEDDPLSPFTEAAEWGVTRAAGYFLAWLLGINLPRMVEWLLVSQAGGPRGTYLDNSAGEVAAWHLMHPLGFLLLFSHIVLFAVFVRFELRFRWLLWPLATGLFWRIVGERL